VRSVARANNRGLTIGIARTFSLACDYHAAASNSKTSSCTKTFAQRFVFIHKDALLLFLTPRPHVGFSAEDTSPQSINFILQRVNSSLTLLSIGACGTRPLPTVPSMIMIGTVRAPPLFPFPRPRSRAVPNVVNDHFVVPDLIHDQIFANGKSQEVMRSVSAWLGRRVGLGVSAHALDYLPLLLFVEFAAAEQQMREN
jgi:hypothetical protein